MDDLKHNRYGRIIRPPRVEVVQIGGESIEVFSEPGVSVRPNDLEACKQLIDKHGRTINALIREVVRLRGDRDGGIVLS